MRSPFTPEDYPPSRRVESKGTVSTIVVFPEYIEGLQDIGGFSHIILLCHLHLAGECALTVTPPWDTVPHGVFATRSPRRPNPISLTVVRLQEVDGNFLHVADLDLLDGTLIRGFEDGCSYESYVIRYHPGGDDEKVVGSPGLQDSR